MPFSSCDVASVCSLAYSVNAIADIGSCITIIKYLVSSNIFPPEVLIEFAKCITDSKIQGSIINKYNRFLDTEMNEYVTIINK